MASTASMLPEAGIWNRLSERTVALIKPSLKRLYQHLAPLVPTGLKTRVKHARELGYWRSQCRKVAVDRAAQDAYYQQLMLDVAGEPDAEFLRDKTVVDFGCGPLGSLCWATTAAERIGVDVLADEYVRLAIPTPGMRVVASTERAVPLVTGGADVVFSVNALDHVSHFETICGELRRILAPGGELIASINLGEPPTLAEPQTLDERRVEQHLLAGLQVVSYRVAPQGVGPGSVYRHFFDGTPHVSRGPRYLWVRARRAA